MASDETMTVLSSVQDEEFDDTDEGYDNQQPPDNLSRLCMYTNEDDDEDLEGMKMYMSRLSIESFDGDADEELSEEKEFQGLPESLSSDDSYKEPECYSLQATPPRWGSINQNLMGVKDYGSENEVEKCMLRQKMRRNLRKRRIMNSNKKENNNNNDGLGFSGESDQSGSCACACGSGVVVITRPKGGRRSLCMGLEEMKACRDLGFELEHECMLEIQKPNSGVSLSGSTHDTSSSDNSPIANWRISSPGDDPRNVKARLKVWAQAVALASTSHLGTQLDH